MGIAQKEWFDLGDGIFLDIPMDKLGSLTSGKMCSLRILNPERFTVAVDTAKKPVNLARNTSDAVILDVQVAWNYAYSLTLVLQCACHDPVHEEWYQIELSVQNQAPHKPELKITKILTPLKNFGKPEADLHIAIRRTVEQMNNDLR